MSDAENIEPEAFAPRRRPKPRSTVGGLIVAVIVVLFLGLCSVVGAVPDGESSGPASAAEVIGYGIGRIIGGALFLALPVWLVLHFAYVKRRNPDVGARHFVILLVAASISGSPVILLEGLRGVRMQENAVIRLVVDDWRASNETEDEADGARIAELVGDGLLDPALLGRPGGLAEARRRSAELETFSQTVFGRTVARAADLKQRLAETDIPAGRRRAVLAEADAALEETRARMERLKGLMTAQTAEIDGVLVFLQTRSGPWHVEGQTLRFQRQSDADEYNRRVARVDAARARLSAEMDAAPSNSEVR